MHNKNNKGRGEIKYGHQTAIGLRKVAGMVVAGFVLAAMMGVGLFAGAQGKKVVK